MTKKNKKAATSVTKIEIKTVKVSKGRTGFKVSETPYDVTMPDGFNFKDYKPLKKKNFKDEALYFEHRAEEMAYKMTAFKAQAEEARTTGSAADRRKKKQIVKLNAKMNELKEQLVAQGIDVEALIAAAAATKE